ncbi:MAG: glycosyltransferase [Spirochaetales bacterium]|nr:glycosyltransferase [Spirochaetales bacterium]
MIDITQEQVMQTWKNEIPLVSVCCITYNHEPYIAQALDGFLMQKTNFPFEVLIHDDASTDKTADIIREYEKKFPKIIKPIYQKENQYSQGKRDISETWNFPRAKGKYIAMCEGDDYWIDENKLQMQVDFLENNPDYGMCYTKANQLIQKTGKFSRTKNGSYVKDFEDLLFNGNRVPTLTTVFRKDLLNSYLKEIYPQNKGWLMGDYPMWLYFAHESRIKFLDKVTSVYRVLENSASHSKDIEKSVNFASSVLRIQNFFSEKYFHKKFHEFDEHLERAFLYLKFNNRNMANKEFSLCNFQNKKIRIYRIICSSAILFSIFRKYKGF